MNANGTTNFYVAQGHYVYFLALEHFSSGRQRKPRGFITYPTEAMKMSDLKMATFEERIMSTK